MTEVVVIEHDTDQGDIEVVPAPEGTACCEHCEANRDAIAAIIAGQAASAEISEDAALEAVAELLELEDIADE